MKKFINLFTCALLIQITSCSISDLLFSSYSVKAQLAQVDEIGIQNVDRIQEQAAKLRDDGDYQAALGLYQKVLHLRIEMGDRTGEGDTLNAIGTVYEYLNSYPEALEAYQKALQIRRQNGDLEGVGNTLANMGEAYRQQSQYDLALEVLQESLKIRTELSDRIGQAETLSSMGSVYHQRGIYQTALTNYQQALDIFEALQDEPNTANTLGNLGSVYVSLGVYKQALTLYDRSLSILKKIGDRANEAGVLHNMGLAHARLKQYSQALEFYQQALAAYNQMGYRLGEANSLNNIGFAYTQLNRNLEAVNTLKQALTIFQEIGDRAKEATTLDSIGTAYSHLQKNEQALNSYQQGLTIASEIGDREVQRTILGNIAYVLEKQNQPELAIVFYKQSVNVTEAIRQDIGELSQEQQESYTRTVADNYRALADLLLKQNRILEAQRVLDLLKIQELDEYLHNVRGSEKTSQGIANISPEQPVKQELETILTQAVELGKELREIEKIPLNQRTPIQQRRIIEIRKIEQQITHQFVTFFNSPEVKALIVQLQQTTGSKNFNLEDATSLRDNLQKFQPNAVILYPFVLDDRLELILVTPYSPPIRRTVSVKREQLNQAILEARRSLTDVESDPTIITHQLYEWLIKPIENDLAQAGTKTIIYAPDGQLRYIPLAALYDGKQWLVQRFQINNITAASLTDFNTKPQEKLQVLAGAFTQGSYTFKLGEQDITLSGLPFAGREVENLAEIVPETTKLLDNDFNRDIVLLMNDYSVVHLATHAEFVAGQPENSFIMLGNGDRVTLRDLESWSLPKVDLVVLSACQTAVGGMGNGQEILGFGYQIQRTGARAAIASLWSVDDGGTQALMNTFYTVITQGHITKAEALRQAQIALITGNYPTRGQPRGIVVQERTNISLETEMSDRLSHPFYWASFILIGNGL